MHVEKCETCVRCGKCACDGYREGYCNYCDLQHRQMLGAKEWIDLLRKSAIDLDNVFIVSQGVIHLRHCPALLPSIRLLRSIAAGLEEFRIFSWADLICRNAEYVLAQKGLQERCKICCPDISGDGITGWHHFHPLPPARKTSDVAA
jgi:hypothetical protein